MSKFLFVAFMLILFAAVMGAGYATKWNQDIDPAHNAAGLRR